MIDPGGDLDAVRGGQTRSRPSVIAIGLWTVCVVLGFLLPSRKTHLNILRIFAVSIGLTTLFLFAARYYVPGGTSQFLLWAQALVDGSTLPPTIAQRDIGFPILVLMSGYTIDGSFIGITLIHALFGVLMPILLYIALRPFSLGVAYYSGQVANLCLGPFLFIKMIHHDQAYIFFMILSIALLIVFFNRSSYKYLYLFTAACAAASVTRPAGNLLFPMFLFVAFVFAARPRRLWHFVNCLIVFLAVNAVYQWHRYEIFNVRSQPDVPSYVGEQVFYNLYINSTEFGVNLGPDIGPHMRQLDTALRQALTQDPPSTKFFRDHVQLVPRPFAERWFLGYSRDELMRQVYLSPNWEYYVLICDAEPDDQIVLGAAGEIARAYPVYVLRYSLRNLIVFLFHPGYAHTRYYVAPLHPIGMEFYPTAGRVYETDSIAERAIAEAQLDPLSVEPWVVRGVLGRTQSMISIVWQKYYQAFVSGTTILMLVAWLALAWTAFCAVTRRLWRSDAGGCRLVSLWAQRNFLAALVSATMLMLYNAAVTAVFVEPNYRYHDFMLLVRVLTAAFGIIVLERLIQGRIEAGQPAHGAYRALAAVAAYFRRGVAVVHAHDIVEICFASRVGAATSTLIFAVTAMSAIWIVFMRAHAG